MKRNGHGHNQMNTSKWEKGAEIGDENKTSRTHRESSSNVPLSFFFRAFFISFSLD